MAYSAKDGFQKWLGNSAILNSDRSGVSTPRPNIIGSSREKQTPSRRHSSTSLCLSQLCIPCCQGECQRSKRDNLKVPIFQHPTRPRPSSVLTAAHDKSLHWSRFHRSYRTQRVPAVRLLADHLVHCLGRLSTSFQKSPLTVQNKFGIGAPASSVK